MSLNAKHHQHEWVAIHPWNRNLQVILVDCLPMTSHVIFHPIQHGEIQCHGCEAGGKWAYGWSQRCPSYFRINTGGGDYWSLTYPTYSYLSQTSDNCEGFKALGLLNSLKVCTLCRSLIGEWKQPYIPMLHILQQGFFLLLVNCFWYIVLNNILCIYLCRLLWQCHQCNLSKSVAGLRERRERRCCLMAPRHPWRAMCASWMNGGNRSVPYILTCPSRRLQRGWAQSGADWLLMTSRYRTTCAPHVCCRKKHCGLTQIKLSF